MKRIVAAGIIGALLVAGVGGYQAPSRVGAASSAQLTAMPVVHATDLAIAATSQLEFTGISAMHLRGVSGPVTGATLIWDGPVDTGDIAQLRLNGIPVTGTLMGTASPGCDGHASQRAYRADVTSIVKGDGPYVITEGRKGNGTFAEGASLIVYYHDAYAANDRDVYVYGGDDTSADGGWDDTLGGIAYHGGDARLELHVGGGQAGQGGSDGPVNLNGVQLVAPGYAFGGESVEPYFFSGKWDRGSFDVSSFLKAGSASQTLHLTHSRVGDASGSDCLSLVAAVISVPTTTLSPSVIAAPCVVTSVLDGSDVLCADGATVRFAGVRTQDGLDPKAPWAQALTTWFVGGKTLTLEAGPSSAVGAPTVNAYPHLMGTDGADYNMSALLAYIGMARAGADGGDPAHTGWFAAAESYAHRSCFNMWSDGNPYWDGSCPPVVLPALSCGLIGTVRSGVDALAARLKFENQSAGEIVVSWINFDGQPVRYYSLPPGGTIYQDTWVTHPWTVTDAGGHCLGVFEPVVGFSHVVIR